MRQHARYKAYIPTMAVFLATLTQTAHAEVESFVVAGALYDDNLLRTPVPQSDTITQAKIGANLVSYFSRQQMQISSTLEKRHFQRYSAFDHIGYAGSARWRWQVLEDWSGDIGYDYVRELSAFDDRQDAMKDIRTEKHGHMNVEHDIDTRWRIRTQYARNEYGHSAVMQQTRDRTVGALYLTLAYATPRLTRIELKARDERHSFPRRQGDFYDFSKRVITSHIAYEIGPDTRAEGEVGWATQRYRNERYADYATWVARIEPRWSFGGAMTLRLLAARELTAVDENSAHHAVDDGVTIEPRWMWSTKIDFTVQAGYRHRDYLTDPRTRLTRDDTLRRLSASVRYMVWRHGEIGITLGQSRRASSMPNANFTSNQAAFSLRLTL